MKKLIIFCVKYLHYETDPRERLIWKNIKDKDVGEGQPVVYHTLYNHRRPTIPANAMQVKERKQKNSQTITPIQCCS